MTATAVAPANIAFIKYWGKRDEELRLPLNDSISMNLSAAYTTTTVEFSEALISDEIQQNFSQAEKDRISKHLDRIRAMAKIRLFARVETQNSFPRSVGIASSASGFAALTLAAATAAGLSLSEKELSILARLGSGSACRSIPDGFVRWEKGESSEMSFARSILPSSYWDLRDVLAVVSREEKQVKSSAGMTGALTSPLLQERLASVDARIGRLVAALGNKDMKAFGEVIEEDCLNMHAVMQTQDPPLVYWDEVTRRLMDAVRTWRSLGVAAYFTIDAGPNVHILCEAKDEEEVVKRVHDVAGVVDVIVNKPAPGAHIV